MKEKHWKTIFYIPLHLLSEWYVRGATLSINIVVISAFLKRKMAKKFSIISKKESGLHLAL